MRWVPVTQGILLTYFQASLGLFFWEYQMSQEQLRDLTMDKVIEECLALFQIKQHYERQNLDPPANFLNEEIKT